MPPKRILSGQLGVNYKTKSHRLAEAKARLAELRATGASADRLELQLRYIATLSRLKPRAATQIGLD